MEISYLYSASAKVNKGNLSATVEAQKTARGDWVVIKAYGTVLSVSKEEWHAIYDAVEACFRGLK